MKVTILGTGTFFVDKDRSGPAYLLEADDKKILIDCGPGTLNRLSQIGVKLDDIGYVLLTHFHPDHTSDLFAFQMSFRLKDFFGDKDYKTPVIYGPKGIDIFTKRLSEVYQLPAFNNYSKIEYKEIQPDFALGGIVVKAFRVQHTAFGATADAFAFRFEHAGKVFVFSGDCIKSPEVEAACTNADLVICDTSYAKGKGSAAHMDTVEVGEIAQTAGVKKVVLTHFFPQTAEVDIVSEVKETYSGEVIRGEDLMEMEV